MMGERSMLQDLRPMSRGRVTFGGSQKGKIVGIGKISKNLFPSIDNVLFVEGLKHNLLMNMTFLNKGECIVKNLNGSLTFSTKRQNNLYKINLTNLTHQNVTCIVSINSDQWTWHKKLGHASLRLISKLKKHNLVKGFPRKQVKRSFESKNIVLTSKPLDFLHIDLFGPTRTAFVKGKFEPKSIDDALLDEGWIKAM
ncbi:hypothetical protein CR513_36365, partial [Mucuna pruriens]